MEQKTKQRIKKINSLDSDKVSITLLNALEVFWSLDRIIDKNTSFYKGQISEYVKSKKVVEEVKEWLQELGNRISDDYLNQGYGHFFSTELLNYLGFDIDDEIADGFIDEYCMSSDKKDINILKKQLLEWAIELEELEKV